MTGEADARFQRALRLRTEQRMDEACAVIADAAVRHPDDARIALAHAHLQFETWRIATPLFERAAALAPGDPAAIAGLAAALASEGAADAAETLLADTLRREPGWIAGHRQLAALRIASGAPDGFDRSFVKACRARPDDMALRLAWFRLLAAARDWPGARRVVGDGIALAGEQRGFDLARVFLASESDEASRDPQLFDAVAGVRDAGLDLCRVRFLLRNGRPEAAAAIASAHVETPAARTFWPYLALAWRMIGDPRAGWLDGDPLHVGTVDLALSPAERAALAARLRALLTAHGPFLEQSVRGGIQTARNLLLHPVPEIRALRQRMTAAVRSYVDALPAAVAGHPLLGVPRDTIRYEGSWTVLLRGGGYHAAHTHVRGWISSALHLELPAPAAAGEAAQAGWLAFGAPPPELGLDLPALRHVEPAPARLVLFPATLWHGTVPFATGERLTVAFDVRPPGG